MFIAALSTLAKSQTQPKYPTTDKCIKETVDYMLSGILLSC